MARLLVIGKEGCKITAELLSYVLQSSTLFPIEEVAVPLGLAVFVSKGKVTLLPDTGTMVNTSTKPKRMPQNSPCSDCPKPTRLQPHRRITRHEPACHPPNGM